MRPLTLAGATLVIIATTTLPAAAQSAMDTFGQGGSASTTDSGSSLGLGGSGLAGSAGPSLMPVVPPNGLGTGMLGTNANLGTLAATLAAGNQRPACLPGVVNLQCPAGDSAATPGLGATLGETPAPATSGTGATVDDGGARVWPPPLPVPAQAGTQ
jgi:hypothetical protein